MDKLLDFILARISLRAQIWLLFVFFALSLLFQNLSNFFPEETKKEITAYTTRFLGVDLTPVLFQVMFWGSASFFVIVFLALATTIIALLAKKTKQPSATRAPEQVDISDWLGEREVSLWDAAHLWAGQVPSPESGPDPFYKYFKRLKGAVVAGKLATVDGSKTANKFTVVSKQELHRYAQSIGEMPGFLFAVVIPAPQHQDLRSKHVRLSEMYYEGLIVKQDFKDHPDWSAKWNDWQGRLHQAYASVSEILANTMQVDHRRIEEETFSNGHTQAQLDRAVLTKMLDDLKEYLTNNAVRL